MNYSCCECLSIAIESQKKALLITLLERPNVFYRDMFLAQKSDGIIRSSIHPIPPTLHNITNSTDLSFVGQPNCGHTQEDVELHIQLGDDTNERVLVSLPMWARWHSTRDFPAEQLLCDSGKFDFSEPQFFHLIECRYLNVGHIYSARILVFSWEKPLSRIMSRNSRNAQQSDVSVWGICSLEALMFSSKIPDFYKFELHLINEQFPPLFYERHDEDDEPEQDTPLIRELQPKDNDFDKGILRELQSRIDAGADLNRYWIVHCIINWENIPKREFSCRGLVSYMCCYLDYLLYFSEQEAINQFQMLLNLLLRNGLCFWLGEIDYWGKFGALLHYQYSKYRRFNKRSFKLDMEKRLFLNFGQWPDPEFYCRGQFSLFSRIIYTLRKRLVEQQAYFRSVAMQLLALGYGRRELHPDGVPLFDEHLDATRKAIRWHKKHRDPKQYDINEYCAAELLAVVDRFDAGPLSLLQLSRIALRRAIGGAHFARRLRTISPLLPPALYDYVADPTELIRWQMSPS